MPCDQLCCVEHLLTECVDLIEGRRQFFKTVIEGVVLRMFYGQHGSVFKTNPFI